MTLSKGKREGRLVGKVLGYYKDRGVSAKAIRIPSQTWHFQGVPCVLGENLWSSVIGWEQESGLWSNTEMDSQSLSVWSSCTPCSWGLQGTFSWLPQSLPEIDTISVLHSPDEWTATHSFFRILHWYKVKAKVKSLGRVRLFATPWTVAYQAPPSMGFSRRECWSGLHFLLQGTFPTQESNPGLLYCR